MIQREQASTTTLPAILEGIEGRVRLLKIDCEGAEKGIFANTPSEALSRIDHVRGELHFSKEENQRMIDLLAESVLRENLRFTLLA